MEKELMKNENNGQIKVGVGMNFWAKEVMARSVLKEEEVTIIDSEKEYRQIAEQLGGTIKGERIIFNGGEAELIE
jgi:hypothetical protein